MANQAVVSGSACASGRASARNEASSSSLPGLASSVTSSPTVTIAISSVSAGIRPQDGQVHAARGRAGRRAGGAALSHLPLIGVRGLLASAAPGILRLAGPQVMTSWAAPPAAGTSLIHALHGTGAHAGLTLG